MQSIGSRRQNLVPPGAFFGTGPLFLLFLQEKNSKRPSFAAGILDCHLGMRAENSGTAVRSSSKLKRSRGHGRTHSLAYGPYLR
jgi:hypothetical protein